MLSALMLAPSFACKGGDLDELKAAHERYQSSFKARDAKAIAGFLHAGYVDFAIDGDTAADWSAKTSEQRVRHFQDLLARYESWDVRLEDPYYRVNGTTGVVSGTERIARKPKGGVLEYPRWRLTATWVKEDGKWMMLSAHRSTMPATAPGARPLGQDAAETRILNTAFETPRWANVPLADARLIRVLAEVSSARHVVELGTSTGFSGLWICNALRKSGGRLTTFELDPGRAAMAREQFKRAGVADMATVVEGDAHENIRKLSGPIDMVFIDAEKDGYPDYLEKLLPLVRPGGIILAHNMRWPTPSQSYIKAVTTNAALETIFLNMDDQGISVTLKKR